mgnify:CR=1 FL=1
MKLLKKTNNNFIFAASAVSVIAGVSLYFLITSIIREETIDTLAVNCLRIEKQISNNDTVYEQTPITEIKKIKSLPKIEYRINDTIIFDEIEDEQTHFTEFTLFKRINAENFAITCRSKSIENIDVFWAVVKSFAGLLILIFGLLYVLNKRSHKKLWAVFYKNLETVKSFNIKNGDQLGLYFSTIDEFNELNIVLNNLTEQINKDFSTLKKFTENASHELQTPLSIIRNNTELLMQSNLDEAIAGQIEKIYNTANRMSHTVEALLFLAKIDNNQFKELTQTNFNSVITNQVAIYKEIFGEEFVFEYKEDRVFTHKMNLHLAEVMVKNLLENSFKHKTDLGKVSINISSNKIIFSNPGSAPETEIHNFFNRFTKANETSASPGLGLAIVNDICKVSGLTISGAYENGNYKFIITHN